jgi:hypothetical protein
MSLDRRTKELLEFERDWPAHEGGKGRAIRARFGFSPARYYELLARAIERDEALAHDPLTVRRLLRRRERRQQRDITSHPSLGGS